MIILESKKISTIFSKNIIKIVKLIVNLIMSGFSGKAKRIFNLSFASDPIMVQGFAYNMDQVARMNEGKRFTNF